MEKPLSDSGRMECNHPRKRGGDTEEMMKKYICDVCGYIYDPETGDPDNGVDPGTSFENIPDDWVCPLCGVGKEDFSVYED